MAPAASETDLRPVSLRTIPPAALLQASWPAARLRLLSGGEAQRLADRAGADANGPTGEQPTRSLMPRWPEQGSSHADRDHDRRRPRPPAAAARPFPGHVGRGAVAACGREVAGRVPRGRLG